MSGEQISGKVAATVGQVFRQVTQDVDHLQPLAEAFAEDEHFAIVTFAPAGRQVALAQARPEFTHATGDKVGVFVQFRCRGERLGRCFGALAKAQEVEFLSPADARERAAQVPAVLRRLGLEPGQAAVELPEEFALAIMGLLADEIALEGTEHLGVRTVLNHVQQGAQVLKPGTGNDGRSVRHRVERPG